ncbi:putative phage abortive infection protein [Luteibacter sp. 22Crub2.1]|uniref:putative phage abortive infection protein n=1 Tax=Luteibacter sp. 22Crub2.1 TaxID=1283288 RepID=UPI0009CFD0CF|nr:putative phage abortive infection protein [Luteibacter sp. 22Crub2.1]SKB85706.1 Putative phage abortive infection protein [Luteibacter sp. 22Crub2.1]
MDESMFGGLHWKWVFVLVAVLTVPIVVLLVVPHAAVDRVTSGWNNLGSYFGGVAGPLLNLFGLLAVLATLRVQSAQLADVRLYDERNRLREREARIENTIGGLLDTLSNIVASITVPWKKRHVTGASAFRPLYWHLRRSFRSQLKTSPGNSVEAATSAYSLFHRQYGSLVGHYFRTYYTIVRSIDESLLADDDRKRLISWLTCRMSRFELLLLFYNGVSVHGTKKLKPLIERYGLLEHLDHHLLFDQAHVLFYDKGAFRQGDHP